jgi:hypothetical protein
MCKACPRSTPLRRSHRDAEFSSTNQVLTFLARPFFHFIERNVFSLRHPQPVQQDGQLTGHRNNGSFLGIFPAAFTDSQAPLAQGTVRSVAFEHVVSTLDEKFAQITIARFGNAKLWIGVAERRPGSTTSTARY